MPINSTFGAAAKRGFAGAGSSGIEVDIVINATTNLGTTLDHTAVNTGGSLETYFSAMQFGINTG